MKTLLHRLTSCTLLLMTTLIVLTSCRQGTGDNRPVLTVSIEPLRYIVEAIAGNHFTVKTLMPQGASPETYEPTPRQMMELTKSRAVFRTGTLGFERTKLPKMIDGAGETRLIDLGQGIDTIESDHHHGHEGEDADSGDPHLWMSPANLALMANNACKALCALDSAHSGEYKRNLARFHREIEGLDKSLHQQLKPLANRTFLIYHPALGYFARDYGLRQLAVEHDGKDPSPAYFQSLVSRGRQAQVSVVFISKEHAGTAARRLAETLDARVMTINPLDYRIPDQLRLIASSLADQTKNGAHK